MNDYLELDADIIKMAKLRATEQAEARPEWIILMDGVYRLVDGRYIKQYDGIGPSVSTAEDGGEE